MCCCKRLKRVTRIWITNKSRMNIQGVVRISPCPCLACPTRKNSTRRSLIVPARAPGNEQGKHSKLARFTNFIGKTVTNSFPRFVHLISHARKHTFVFQHLLIQLHHLGNNVMKCNRLGSKSIGLPTKEFRRLRMKHLIVRFEGHTCSKHASQGIGFIIRSFLKKLFSLGFFLIVFLFLPAIDSFSSERQLFAK